MANVNLKFNDVLENVKESIKKELCCCKIGKIERFYPETKTADVSIQVKHRKSNGELMNNSFIINAPVMGNTITLPITEGEYCIILFNDFDKDLWYETGHNGEPETTRTHDLTDAIIITGLNGFFNKINYDNTRINLNYNAKINGTQETTEDALFDKNVTININLTVKGNLTAGGQVEGGTLKADNGASGTFIDSGSGASGKTLTIVDGIVTNIG
jgi:hypothetical protein